MVFFFLSFFAGLSPWSLVSCIAEMAEKLPFSYLCKAVVEGKKYGEGERKMERIG